MWINETPCVLMGVGIISAAYWRPTLAAIFKQNRDSTDIVNFATTIIDELYVTARWSSSIYLIRDTRVKSLCVWARLLDCNISSAKLKRQVMTIVINPQNLRPQRSSSSAINKPAGNSVAQAREKDTNTELGINLREYTWPSKAITVKNLEHKF